MFGVIGGAIVVGMISLQVINATECQRQEMATIKDFAEGFYPDETLYYWRNLLRDWAGRLLGACPGPMFVLLGSRTDHYDCAHSCRYGRNSGAYAALKDKAAALMMQAGSLTVFSRLYRDGFPHHSRPPSAPCRSLITDPIGFAIVRGPEPRTLTGNFPATTFLV